MHFKFWFLDNNGARADKGNTRNEASAAHTVLADLS